MCGASSSESEGLSAFVAPGVLPPDEEGFDDAALGFASEAGICGAGARESGVGKAPGFAFVASDDGVLSAAGEADVWPEDEPGAMGTAGATSSSGASSGLTIGAMIGGLAFGCCLNGAFVDGAFMARGMTIGARLAEARGIDVFGAGFSGIGIVLKRGAAAEGNDFGLRDVPDGVGNGSGAATAGNGKVLPDFGAPDFSGKTFGAFDFGASVFETGLAGFDVNFDFVAFVFDVAISGSAGGRPGNGLKAFGLPVDAFAEAGVGVACEVAVFAVASLPAGFGVDVWAALEVPDVEAAAAAGAA